MQFKYISVSLLALIAPASLHAATACQDMAAYIRTQGPQGIQWNWKGAEVSGQVYSAWRSDAPEAGFKPVFQDQRDSLLKEAKAKSPDILDDWQALLSPTADAFPVGKNLTLEELKDGSIGVLRVASGGNQGYEARAYYYRDPQGLVHIAGQPQGFPKIGAWAKYDWVSSAAQKGGETLIRLNEKVLVVSDAPATGSNREVFTVWQWQGTGFDRQCLMDVNYTFRYEREAVFDNPAQPLSAEAQFLATYIDGWGHYYRRAFDIDGQGRSMSFAQKALLDDFGKKHSAQVATINQIIKAAAQPNTSRLFYPVILSGRPNVVSVEQDYVHSNFQDNLSVSLYALDGGKLVSHAQINAIVKRVALTDIGFVYLDKASSRTNTLPEQ